MIKLYFASDDSLVSEDSSSPVEFTLRADLEENDSVRLYAEADSGFEVTGTEVEPIGTTAAKWALAPDSGGSEGTYEANGDPLTLGTVGNGAGNEVFFWARAEATDDESPTNDDTVTLDVTGIAEAV